MTSMARSFPQPRAAGQLLTSSETAGAAACLWLLREIVVDGGREAIA
jgi:hypothetical protein